MDGEDDLRRIAVFMWLLDLIFRQPANAHTDFSIAFSIQSQKPPLSAATKGKRKKGLLGTFFDLVAVRSL